MCNGSTRRCCAADACPVRARVRSARVWSALWTCSHCIARRARPRRQHPQSPRPLLPSRVARPRLLRALSAVGIACTGLTPPCWCWHTQPLDIKELQANDEWVLIHFWDRYCCALVPAARDRVRGRGQTKWRSRCAIPARWCPRLTLCARARSTSAESLRTLPYVKKMHEYYGKHGLQVVGVHRPRYDFARSLVLLADAVRRLEIEYPVVNDVDADVAHAYGAKQLDTMYLINDDNLIVGRKSGREAGPIMMSSVCKALASKNPALACLPAAAVQTSLSSSAPAASADADAARQSLYTNYYGNPNHPRAGHRCRPATADVFVGEARASDLDVGTTAGRGSLTHLQSYAGLLQRKHYSDMSGVQLDDGAFVLRCLAPCAIHTHTHTHTHSTNSMCVYL
jgi:hypothetical protein